MEISCNYTGDDPSIDFNCDMYAFVRVKNDLTVGWFLGVKTSKDYFEKARFLKKGDKDGDNGFTVRGDCYNMKISELDKV